MLEFDFTLYSSTELADIGAVLEYRRLSVNLPRSDAGLQAPREGFLDTPDSESDFSELHRSSDFGVNKVIQKILSLFDATQSCCTFPVADAVEGLEHLVLVVDLTQGALLLVQQDAVVWRVLVVELCAQVGRHGPQPHLGFHLAEEEQEEEEKEVSAIAACAGQSIKYNLANPRLQDAVYRMRHYLTT